MIQRILVSALVLLLFAALPASAADGGLLDQLKRMLGGKEEVASPEPALKDAAAAPSATAEPYRSKTLPKQLKTPGSGPVVVVAVSEVIDLGLAPFITRSLEFAQEQKAALFVMEMDTPGGRVDAALKIKDALLSAKVPTLVYINRQAISAGALIAYGTDYIAWAPGGTMGAATPISFGGPEGGAGDVGEKMLSFMRGVMRATAEAKGRDPLVAEAMVDPRTDLPGFAPSGKLLTCAYGDAAALGLIDYSAKSLDELLANLGLAANKRLTVEENWAETIARFLTHPVVSSLLMSLGVLGIVTEFYTPGFGLAGIFGGLCVLAFFFGHAIVYLAGLEELLLLILGLILLALEFVAFPGTMIAGLAGVLSITAALVLALIGLRLDLAIETGLLESAVVKVFGSLAIAGVLIIVVIRMLPDLRPARRLILSRNLAEANASPSPGDKSALIGKVLTADSDLGPSGFARIDGARVEIVTQGDYVVKGALVEVLDVKGARLLVRQVPAKDDKS